MHVSCRIGRNPIISAIINAFPCLLVEARVRSLSQNCTQVFWHSRSILTTRSKALSQLLLVVFFLFFLIFIFSCYHSGLTFWSLEYDPRPFYQYEIHFLCSYYYLSTLSEMGKGSEREASGGHAWVWALPITSAGNSEPHISVPVRTHSPVVSITGPFTVG